MTQSRSKQDDRFGFDTVPSEEPCEWERCAVCDGSMDQTGTKARCFYRDPSDGHRYVTSAINLCAGCTIGAEQYAEIFDERYAARHDFVRGIVHGVRTPRGNFENRPGRCPRCGAPTIGEQNPKTRETGLDLCTVCWKWFEVDAASNKG